MRNPLLIKAKFFQAVFMSLFIGGLFFDIGTKDYTQRTNWQSISGFLFDTTINAMMTALSPITLSFPLERDVFFKEQDSKMYNVFQYYLARNLVEIP
jgi:ABC-type multidrug transport system permease subunit